MSKNLTEYANYREALWRISWGKPQQIVIAKLDRRCPRCGKSVKDDLGLDLGYEENGKFFGAICFNCGWTC